MSYRRLRAILIKELHHITRDARSLAMALLVPVMMLLLFGTAISFDVKDVKVAILDQDHTPDSRKLVDTIRGSGYCLREPD